MKSCDSRGCYFDLPKLCCRKYTFLNLFLDSNGLSQQDNATQPKRVLTWPLNSSDFNPNEHLWVVLGGESDPLTPHLKANRTTSEFMCQRVRAVLWLEGRQKNKVCGFNVVVGCCVRELIKALGANDQSER